MRPFGLIVSMLGVLIVADAGDDAAKKDLAKFQANWQLISAERDGKKTPQEDAKKITLTIGEIEDCGQQGQTTPGRLNRQREQSGEAVGSSSVQ